MIYGFNSVNLEAYIFRHTAKRADLHYQPVNTSKYIRRPTFMSLRLTSQGYYSMSSVAHRWQRTGSRSWADVGQLVGRRWATLVGSRRSTVGPPSADCRRRPDDYQPVTPSVAHRWLPTADHCRSRWWADDGPLEVCYLGYCVCL